MVNAHEAANLPWSEISSHYCPWSWSSIPSSWHRIGHTAGLPLEWDQFMFSTMTGKGLWLIFVSPGVAFTNLTEGLAGFTRCYILSPLLCPEPKQVRYNQSRPWMCVVFLRIPHHPIWQRTNIPFAVSEWGPWGLKQPSTHSEAWEVPALPSPKGEWAWFCWEFW